MYDISFVNAGYNVAEPMNIHFDYTTPRHLFLYFQGDVTVNGKAEKAGACIIYSANSPRDYITGQGFVNSYMSFTAPSELFSKLGIKTDRVFYPSNCADINAILFDICSENVTREKGFEEKFYSLILNLLVTAARGSNPVKTDKVYDLKSRISAVRTAFLSDIVNPPSFDALLCEANISRTQGYKLYSMFFHTSPKEDLIWARLEKARSLIRSDANIKIYTVVETCGFSNVSHFFRTFKNRYGYTPKDYANAIKNTPTDR
ncbi:MAG: helix-turn-helix transcriptional regulator [Clostridia bacterium]|nr:helix-turn-helix transcriptional regulator [Clostridia bacterium]